MPPLEQLFKQPEDLIGKRTTFMQSGGPWPQLVSHVVRDGFIKAVTSEDDGRVTIEIIWSCSEGTTEISGTITLTFDPETATTPQFTPDLTAHFFVPGVGTISISLVEEIPLLLDDHPTCTFFGVQRGAPALCGDPTVTAVIDPNSSKLHPRCESHEGQVTSGLRGKVVPLLPAEANAA